MVLEYKNMIKNNNNEYFIFKKQNTSNGFKSIIKQKYIFFLKYKFKKLNFSKKWNSGQNKKGMRIVNTKKSLNVKIIKNKINYSYRFFEIRLCCKYYNFTYYIKSHFFILFIKWFSNIYSINI